MRVLRTCTEISQKDGERPQHEESQSRPLEEFRDSPAYVLVGDPGAGKTTAFEEECEALGEQACLVTARDFLTFDPQNHPEWRGKTLYIDGLDEIRAGTSDVRTPFHEIRGRLDALGKPRFRLSCREADWLGENDRKHLEAVSPDSSVTVLRLDPLTDRDVASILDARPDIPDADAFIKAAKERRVEGLLPNPQTLEMLADVVGAGEGWPESRMQTFEMACRQMVREHNDEHAAAQEPDGPPPPDQLLDAAGRLCALQLISGGSGYTLRGQPDEEYPVLDQCDYDSQVLRLALATKLFKGASSNRFSPVHRHIAEYLGARHLARVIQERLPTRRVIALMEGEDGTVVTEMRGLSAWLAAQSPVARMDLIERDPIGVGLYGDIGGVSLEERRALLASLKREGIRLGSLWSSAAAFGELATPPMGPVLREILTDPGRSRDDELFTGFVLRALSEGTPLPDLGALLLEIVRDKTRWPSVNTSALNAFIHNSPDSRDRADELKSLLADIRGERVSDPDNELLGILLYELYPRYLSPSEVWDCFYATRDRESFFGMYYGFYMLGLPEKSSDDQVTQLLDSLNERFSGLRPTAENSSRLENLPVKLLARGLQAHGDQVAIGRLYDWLDLGFTKDRPMPATGDQKDIQQIGSWLEHRPDLLKAIVMEGMGRCPESDESRMHMVGVLHRWYGASWPSDFGLWCLEQAVSMAGERPHVAEHLLGWAVHAHREHSGNAGLSLEILQERTQETPRLRERLEELLSPPRYYQEHLEQEEKLRQEEEEKRQQELDYIRSRKTAFLENRAPAALLYHIATLYVQGAEVLEESLGGERSLIDAALHGLWNSIHREDVPTLEEILRLREQDRMHYLGEPFLAGIEEAAKTTDVCQLEDDLICRAIAFHCNWPLLNRNCRWYERLLSERPEMVAQVLVESAVSGFRSGREHIEMISELAYDKGLVQVARHASLPLLRAFPTRCKSKQIEALDHLLKAAIQHADREAVQALIEAKLSRKSMNDSQRVYWLAAGLIVSPGAYEDLLREFSEGRESRMRHLTTFFSSRGSARSVAAGLRSPALELLVRLVGSIVGPEEQWKGGYFTPSMEASRLASGLIQRLAACPAKEASGALARLLEDESLSQWHDVLSRAQDEQRVIRRDAGYQHPDIAQICKTLDGGTPANAADLAALLMDLLQGPPERPGCPRGRAEAPAQGSVRGVPLALQIRGNTDGWRQYWNVDSNGSPTGPRHEDVCRDALVDALRRLLGEGVDAQPEGQYANDKRADIRVSCGDFQVPVEIKKNMHRDLWRALRDQLISSYTTDPATGGYGIYLVFWFGREYTQPPPSGGRPADPEELSERLAAEANLSPVEARKISICVVDVSRPEA